MGIRSALVTAAVCLFAFAGIPLRADSFSFLISPVPAPAGDTSEAFGINNRGQIAGAVGGYTVNGTTVLMPVGPTLPTVWQKNGALNFLSLDYPLSMLHEGAAFSINNQGEVVGFVSDDFTYGAVWNSQGAITAAHELSDTFFIAGLNDHDQIVGGAYFSPNGGEFTGYQGSIKGGSFSIASLPINRPGVTYTSANGINNQGQIVGSIGSNELYIGPAQNKFSFDNGQGYLLNHGALTMLNFDAFGINDSGTEIVGDHTLWDQGVEYNLDNSLPIGSGWSSISAYGVNNQGDIVGTGEYNGIETGFEMVPVAPTPEPPSAALLLMVGICGLIVAEKRKSRNARELSA